MNKEITILVDDTFGVHTNKKRLKKNAKKILKFAKSTKKRIGKPFKIEDMEQDDFSDLVARNNVERLVKLGYLKKTESNPADQYSTPKYSYISFLERIISYFKSLYRKKEYNSK